MLFLFLFFFLNKCFFFYEYMLLGGTKGVSIHTSWKTLPDTPIAPIK